MENPNNFYEDYVDNLLDIANSIDTSKKTLLTGRNAGGKSFIREVLTESW
jgi:hypothetical protein